MQLIYPPGNQHIRNFEDDFPFSVSWDMAKRSRLRGIVNQLLTQGISTTTGVLGVDLHLLISALPGVQTA